MRRTTASKNETQGKSPSSLSEVLLLLNSIFARNKNQHRTQTWWKPFSILRKHVQKIVALDVHEHTLKDSAHPRSAADVDAKDFRRRFELEAQVRCEREVVVRWIRDVLCPRCYVTFSALVADTQFANLGVVLLGLLSEIAGVVGLPRAVNAEDTARDDHFPSSGRGPVAAGQARRLIAQSLRVTGLDRGTLVERVYDSDDLGEVVEREAASSESELANRDAQQETDTPMAMEDEDYAQESDGADGADPIPGDNARHDLDVEMNGRSRTRGNPAILPPKSVAQLTDLQAGVSARNQTQPKANLSRKSSPAPVPAPLTTKSRPAATPSATSSSSRSERTPESKGRDNQASTALDIHRKPATTRSESESRASQSRVKQAAKAGELSKGTGIKKKKKKGNAIDDMFAGFG